METAGAFRDYLIRFAGKSAADETDAIIGAFTQTHFRKADFFCSEGKPCRWFCFIESGILQHAVSIDGQQKTTYLALRNSATSSLESFLHQTPSRKDIRAITDAVLWTIGLDAFLRLRDENETFRRFYYNLIERQICLIDDYRIDLLSLSPEARYQKLLETEPVLLREVPLHYLASFLGISQRHMSRIRASVK
jgi:CRP-like cAMP-binding protein